MVNQFSTPTSKVLSKRNPIKTVGRVLKGFRRTQGVSQGTIADAAGTSVTHLSRIESGQATVGVDLLDRLLTALGQSWGSFGKAVDALGERAGP